MRILHFIFLFFFIAGSHAWAMKIGVVDLNRALNESEAGIRSKNVLETKGRQKQQEFKLEEEELRELAEDGLEVKWLLRDRARLREALGARGDRRRLSGLCRLRRFGRRAERRWKLYC